MIKPADIIGIMGSVWASKLITWAEGGGLISHVGLVLCIAPIVLVLETVNPETRVVPLDVAVQQHPRVFLMKALTLTDNERKLIVREACKWSTADYSFTKCIWAGLDEITKTTWFSENLYSSPDQAQCSWTVAQAYKAAGKYFGRTTW